MKETPYFFEGDDEWDTEVAIIEKCRINFIEYSKDPSLLTREIFEANLDKILEIIHPDDSIAHYILGFLILKLEAKAPDNLLDRIANLARPEYDIYRFHDKEKQLKRELLLEDLRRKIIKHKLLIYKSY